NDSATSRELTPAQQPPMIPLPQQSTTGDNEKLFAAAVVLPLLLDRADDNSGNGVDPQIREAHHNHDTMIHSAQSPQRNEGAAEATRKSAEVAELEAKVRELEVANAEWKDKFDKLERKYEKTLLMITNSSSPHQS
ncbi:hypothetical protein PFISCL1PPCAC_7700, partial [Pristionchus fissidentatus]